MAKTGKAYVARDPSALARTTVLWLYLLIAASAVGLVSDLYRYRALSRSPPDTPVSFFESSPGLEQVDSVTALASLPLVVILVVSGILVLKWIYRVTLNSHVLASDVRISPPWAIGWFFIPFANLFKPFQSLADAWKVSLDPAAWRDRPTPGLLRWWWGLWLFVSTLDNASLRLELRADSVAEVLRCVGMDVVSDVLWIPLCLLLIRIVRRLSAQQSDALNTLAFS